MRAFKQVDVFGSGPFGGNPVAVVLDAEGLADEDMQRIATWTNLSETTFVLPPTRPDATYRVRIFTPSEELPFAGHPTLGTAHAWRERKGVRSPHPSDVGCGDLTPFFVQECGAGLIDVRLEDGQAAFAAPPRLRDGPVDAALAARVRAYLGVEDVVDMRWCDNGPGWIGVLLEDADAVLALRPGGDALKVGVAGPGGAADWAVRCFYGGFEDPVTGSFNAALAQWLLEDGRATAPYLAAQNTGRVHVSEDTGQVWVGGTTVTRIDGAIMTD